MESSLNRRPNPSPNGGSEIVRRKQTLALYRHFLFLPRRKVRDGVSELAGVGKKDVYIPTVDGGRMHGWFFCRQGAPRVVLLSHGNSGNLDNIKWLIENLLLSGVSVLAYDYRGYGNSLGRATVESVADDGLCAYDFLCGELGYESSSVILYGQSIGCAVTCHIMNNRQCSGVILQSGFSSLRGVVAQRFPLLSLSRWVPDALDNASILSTNDHPPLLLMHGTRDHVVPVANSHHMYEKAKGAKQLVLFPGAGHRLFPEADAGHKQAVKDFVESLLAG